MREPLDGYPEIEKQYRGDGSPEAVERCMKPIKDNVKEIIRTVEDVLKHKGLECVNIFSFQSRVLGTCKPGSDLDTYVQLHEKHREFVEENGVWYKGSGMQIICGEWAVKYFADTPEEVKDRLKKYHIDIFYGISPIPPAKDEYKGKNYYVNLKELF